MPIHHLTLAADGRQALFPSEAERRLAVRTLARVGGASIVLFSVVDEHVHVVANLEPEGEGRLARALLLALRPLTSVSLDPARVRPVEGRSHLERLVRYVLQQPVHHGIPTHPALWTGSCFPDLVGARILPGFQATLAEFLPRLPQAALFGAVGLSVTDGRPTPTDTLRHLGATRIRDAATAVLAVGPDLEGRADDVVAVQAATCLLAQEAGIARREVASAIGVPLRTAQRRVHHVVPAEILDAVRVHLALEEAVRRAPPVVPPAGPTAGSRP